MNELFKYCVTVAWEELKPALIIYGAILLGAWGTIILFGAYR